MFDEVIISTQLMNQVVSLDTLSGKHLSFLNVF